MGGNRAWFLFVMTGKQIGRRRWE